MRMKKRILQYLLIGLLTVGMLLPCTSVEAKAAVNTNYKGGTGITSMDQEIEYLEGLQMALVEKLSQLTESHDKYQKEANFAKAEEAIKQMNLLVKQITAIDTQIEKLNAGICPSPQPPRDVNLEGDINGVTYPITISGIQDGDRKVVPTVPITYPGTITFTEDCRINNLHVLAADSVTALPGVEV